MIKRLSVILAPLFPLTRLQSFREHTIAKTPRRLTRGFTLIEVLISMFVLGTSVVALNTLQLKSMQHANMALQRSLANLIAIDAAERLWLAHAIEAHPALDEVERRWLSSWDDNARPPGPLALPGVESSRITRAANSFVITVAWHEPRLESGPHRHMEYHLTLPTQ